jgi:hypothetical protein
MGAQISHTSSGEWQSFEGRMRRRRAERCILRAQVAAEAGCLEDARAALDEARKLAPGLADIDAVEANIFGRGETIVADPALPGARGFFYYAACAAAVLASVAILSIGFSWWQRTNRLAPAAPATVRTPLPGPSADTKKPAVPHPSRDVRIETVAVTAMTMNEPAMPTRPVSAVLEARAETVTPPPSVPTTAPEPMLRTVEREAPHPDAVPAVDTSLATTRDLAPLRNLELDSTSTPLGAAPLPAPIAPRIDENNAVRTVLHRYADAYSRLDALAAQQVWPRVNRAALSRAFDSLASQDISLGNCAVDVSGASARATCDGAATWAPKVGGGGARTESRAWTFQLAKAGENWQIVNARVQNR